MIDNGNYRNQPVNPADPYIAAGITILMMVLAAMIC